MKNDDTRIKKLYTEAFDNIHASDELKRKVIEMKDTNNNKRGKIINIRKIVYISAAVVALVVAGGMIAAKATKGPYEQEETVKIIYNGEEKDAYFHEWNEDNVSWRFEVDDREAWIYVTHTGTVDINTTMYVVDNGEYMIASDEPEPTLNLYTDIDRSSIAKIVDSDESFYDQKMLVMETPIGTHSMTLAIDEDDGVADGVSNHGNGCYDVFTVMSDGSIAETCVYAHSGGLNGVIEYFVEKSVDNYVTFDEDNYNPYTFEDEISSME